MSRIENSLQAIKSYDPKGGVFLRISDSGSGQYLEAVRLSWFGRLLIWLGCSNASMEKIARFLARNIEALCRTEPSSFALGGLIKKVEKFDCRTKKISLL